MDDLLNEEEAKPYFEEEYHVGRLLIRKTRADSDWIRFQAGKKMVENRCYPCRAMNGRGFNESVVVFHLYGVGKTEEEAISMANKQHGY